mgnify:CR=1 FL=1
MSPKSSCLKKTWLIFPLGFVGLLAVIIAISRLSNIASEVSLHIVVLVLSCFATSIWLCERHFSSLRDLS